MASKLKKLAKIWEYFCQNIMTHDQAIEKKKTPGTFAHASMSNVGQIWGHFSYLKRLGKGMKLMNFMMPFFIYN